MKKVIILMALIFSMGAIVGAQTIKREGKTYIEQANSKSANEIKTGFTYKDSKGKEYDIYIGVTGSCYINKVSQKTGKAYRKYLGETISKEICASLGRKYTPRNSK